jgi:hypothetical protein
MTNENGNNNLRKVFTKVMTVNKPVDRVFDFFENMKNMEIGGAIKSVTKGDDGWWTFEHIVSGKSKMKQISVRQFAILDHLFIGGNGLEWNVYTRIIPNQNGSSTIWIFIKPDGITEKEFEEQLKGFDNEINLWKNSLEN